MSEHARMSLGKALDLVIGYCSPELYQMAVAHPGMPVMREAVLRLLEEDGLSWPQFLTENPVRLGLTDVSE